MNNKIKNPSPLVQAVLHLDDYLAEIVRLGDKIESMELKSEFDFEHAQRLMNRFTECGQSISEEVMRLSATLGEARDRAEAAGRRVAERAEVIKARQDDTQQKMESFRNLGEKVRDLTLSLNDLKQNEEENLSPESRARISSRLATFEIQLQPLIEEARDLRKAAQGSRLKTLEQSADSLVQSLSAIGKRIETFKNTELVTH